VKKRRSVFASRPKSGKHREKGRRAFLPSRPRVSRSRKSRPEAAEGCSLYRSGFSNALCFRWDRSSRTKGNQGLARLMGPPDRESNHATPGAVKPQAAPYKSKGVDEQVDNITRRTVLGRPKTSGGVVGGFSGSAPLLGFFPGATSPNSRVPGVTTHSRRAQGGGTWMARTSTISSSGFPTVASSLGAES
jgi:hypothetical protein